MKAGTLKLPAARSPEGAHAEVGEDERERGCQCDLPHSGRTCLISVVLTDRSPSPYDGEDQEEQTGDFQPEHVQHVSDAAEGDGSRPVKSAHPSVLAALSSGDAEKRPALGAEIAG